jgi:hypothetical protein
MGYLHPSPSIVKASGYTGPSEAKYVLSFPKQEGERGETDVAWVKRGSGGVVKVVVEVKGECGAGKLVPHSVTVKLTPVAY